MSAMLADNRPDQATAGVDAPLSERKRVVIIGGGFAGLAAARGLRYADAEVVLIDRRNHHIFQPLLYQVATAVLSPAEIAAPIRPLEAKQRNVSVLLADVTGVDVASRAIEASSPGVGVRNGSAVRWVKVEHTPYAAMRDIATAIGVSWRGEQSLEGCESEWLSRCNPATAENPSHMR